MVDSLIGNFHVATISICRTYLMTRVHEVLDNDGFFLQVKEELLKAPIKKKYEG